MADSLLTNTGRGIPFPEKGSSYGLTWQFQMENSIPGYFYLCNLLVQPAGATNVYDTIRLLIRKIPQKLTWFINELALSFLFKNCAMQIQFLQSLIARSRSMLYVAIIAYL